jgi:hypothetical protein
MQPWPVTAGSHACRVLRSTRAKWVALPLVFCIRAHGPQGDKPSAGYTSRFFLKQG